MVVSYAGVILTSLAFVFSDVHSASPKETSLSITLQQSPLFPSLRPVGL